MGLTEREREFLETQHSAAMITVDEQGVAKAVRVGIALFDGRIWSSGTEARVRTRRLRVDPRCTLFVFDTQWLWLALETRVTILDGPEVPAESLRLFRFMQGQPEGPLTWFGETLDDEAFLAKMVEEGRVIYDFEVERSYGML